MENIISLEMLQNFQTEFKKRSYYFSLKNMFVCYIDNKYFFKYILKDDNELITMYINNSFVTITRNFENEINEDTFVFNELDVYGEKIFDKPTEHCGIYDIFGIFNDYYCSSGEGYRLSYETDLCSILHAFKIIHIDFVVPLIYPSIVNKFL
jgi:hypothetical protein